jgi:membrane protease subunit HflK
MNGEHDHPHPHGEPPVKPAPVDELPEVSEDAGSQALADALRRSFGIVKILMVALVIVFLFSGFFTVGPQEKAIILRFGKPVGDGRLLGPGPHWAFPAPIDEKIKIPVGQVLTLRSSLGWYATTAAIEAAGMEPPPTPALNPAHDGYLITADENIIHVRATLRYRIAEPGLRYMLEFGSVTNVLRNAFNNALFFAAARYKVDDALTRDQAGFRETVRARLEQLVRQQDLGIVIEKIDNVEVKPPRQLKEAFARVLESEVRSSKSLNDSRSYENQTLSKARADAEGRLNVGAAERVRLVEFVAAEVERFTNNLPAWRSNPSLFMEQRQAESLRNIFANAQEKLAAPQRDGVNRTVLLQINRDPPKPKALELPKDDHH